MKTKNAKANAGKGAPQSATSYRATKASEPSVIRDAMPAYAVDDAPMMRTQIYLSKSEHEFVQNEGARQGLTMAAVIRKFIDSKMEIPDDAWTSNPMLRPAPHDPEWKGHEDGAANLDHYIYGGPKKWVKVKGEFVEAPPLPEDYHSNTKSRQDYDRKLRKLDETR